MFIDITALTKKKYIYIYIYILSDERIRLTNCWNGGDWFFRCRWVWAHTATLYGSVLLSQIQSKWKELNLWHIPEAWHGDSIARLPRLLLFSLRISFLSFIVLAVNWSTVWFNISQWQHFLIPKYILSLSSERHKRLIGNWRDISTFSMKHSGDKKKASTPSQVLKI